MSESNTIRYILEATALASNGDTHFAAVTEGQQPLLSNVDSVKASYSLARMLNRVDEGDLYVQMINNGNLIDMQAELTRQLEVVGEAAPYDKWQRIAEAILSVRDSQPFRLLRAQIFRPFAQPKENVQQLINQAKQAIVEIPGVPAGVSSDLISWDAVSYKIAASAAEMFCIKHPRALEQMSAQDLSIIDQAQQVCMDTIKEKCAEFRERQETSEDEFVPDVTIYLETAIAGKPDSKREDKIRMKCTDVLRAYVDRLQALFVTGNLPGAIAPSKVFACHDIVSAAQLRGSLMRLSEIQVTQEDDIIDNPAARRRQQILGQQNIIGLSDRWTDKQRQSITANTMVDVGYQMGLKGLRSEYNKPMKETRQQVSGGANTLADQMELNVTGCATRMTRGETENLKQQLSVLLACLRIRCDATQSSAWEMIPAEDFDHMEIVKHLAQHATLTVDDSLYRTATVLQTTYMTGHQTMKFAGRELSPELEQLVTYSVQGRLRSVLSAIPSVQLNLEEDGSLFEGIMQSVFMACAQNQRIMMETVDRAIRRRATTNAAQLLTQ